MNRNIYLIPCCKEKLEHKAPARELYQSEGFKTRLAYAESQHPDAIYVLSGKYHLVTLTKEIEPYDLNLCEQTAEYKEKWAQRVLEDLSLVSNLKDDRYIILCDESYYEGIVHAMERFEIPLAGLNHEERLNFMTRNTQVSREPRPSTTAEDAKSQAVDGQASRPRTVYSKSFIEISAMTCTAKQHMLATDDDSLFQQLFEMYPTDGMVHYRYGEALEYLGRYKHAVEEYKTAENMFPMLKYKALAEGAIHRCMDYLN